jgi:D-threo-aldose 1-dehydrogenase
VASALVGCRSPAEVENNAELFDREIPDALWRDLADIEV